MLAACSEPFPLEYPEDEQYDVSERHVSHPGQTGITLKGLKRQNTKHFLKLKKWQMPFIAPGWRIRSACFILTKIGGPKELILLS